MILSVFKGKENRIHNNCQFVNFVTLAQIVFWIRNISSAFGSMSSFSKFICEDFVVVVLMIEYAY